MLFDYLSSYQQKLPSLGRKNRKRSMKLAGICNDPLMLLRACSDLPSEQKVPGLQHYNGKEKTMMMIGKIKICMFIKKG